MAFVLTLRNLMLHFLVHNSVCFIFHTSLALILPVPWSAFPIKLPLLVSHLILLFLTIVSSICKSSYFHLQALKHIRPVLTDEMALSIAVALVQSRLDYANSLLYRTSARIIHKRQRVQNMASRLVLRNNLSSAAALAQLHWLPINKRIEFKPNCLPTSDLSSTMMLQHVSDHLHSRSFINLLFAQQSASALSAALLLTPFHFLVDLNLLLNFSRNT